MKITYDSEADAAYIQLSELEPDDVIEASDGINLDMTDDDKLIGIEILDASKKFSIATLRKFEYDDEMVEEELVEA
jgi:uncharacterized protein YuzE